MYPFAFNHFQLSEDQRWFGLDSPANWHIAGILKIDGNRHPISADT